MRWWRVSASWYRVTILAEDVNRALSAIIQFEFADLFNAAGAPEDAAMFSSQPLDTGLELYFSPGAYRIAKSLIKRYHGVPCEKPSGNIHLMVGCQKAKEILF